MSEGEKGDRPREPHAIAGGWHGNHPPTVIFAGFARLPANATAPGTSSALAVELEVDLYDLRIVDATCDHLPSLGRKFLISLLVGRRLEDGIEEPVREIRARYFSVTQRAMIAALEDLLRHYNEFQKRNQEGKSEDR